MPYRRIVVSCWEHQGHERGTCCLDCIVNETNRRAGVDVIPQVHDIEVRSNGYLVSVVRACCAHREWQKDAVVKELEEIGDVIGESAND